MHAKEWPPAPHSYHRDGKPAKPPKALPPPDPSTLLEQGAQGEAVLYLQRLLLELGYRDIDRALHVDAAFGDRTRHAVQAFQYDYGLLVDGIVGPLTWKALRHAERVHRLSS